MRVFVLFSIFISFELHVYISMHSEGICLMCYSSSSSSSRLPHSFRLSFLPPLCGARVGLLLPFYCCSLAFRVVALCQDHLLCCEAVNIVASSQNQACLCPECRVSCPLCALFSLALLEGNQF